MWKGNGKGVRMRDFREVIKRTMAMSLVVMTIATTWQNDLYALAESDAVQEETVLEEATPLEETGLDLAQETVVEELPQETTDNEQTISEEEMAEPTAAPTATVEPTVAPTEEPTATPTATPTPSATPTVTPTVAPKKHVHVDKDENYVCDDENCKAVLEHDCVAMQDKCICKYCEEEMEHVDDNNDGYCDICNEIVDEELAHKIKLNPHTLHATAGNYNITIKGNLPDGAYAQASLVYNTAQVENLIENKTDEKVQVVAAIDVTIYDADHNVFQPEDYGETVEVTFSNLDIDKPEDVNVYRVNDNNSVDEIGTDAVSNSAVEFEAEHFTIYVITTVTTCDYPEDYEPFNTITQYITVNDGVEKYYQVQKANLKVYVPEGESLDPSVSVKVGTRTVALSDTSVSNQAGDGQIVNVSIEFGNGLAYDIDEITGGEQVAITFNPGSYNTFPFAILQENADDQKGDITQFFEIDGGDGPSGKVPMDITLSSAKNDPANVNALSFDVADNHASNEANRAVYMKGQSGSIAVTYNTGKACTKTPSQSGDSITNLGILNGKLVFKADKAGETELLYSVNGTTIKYYIEVIEATLPSITDTSYGQKDAMVPTVTASNGSDISSQLDNYKWTAGPTINNAADYLKLSATDEATVSYTYKGVAFSNNYAITPRVIDNAMVIKDPSSSVTMKEMFENASYTIGGAGTGTLPVTGFTYPTDTRFETAKQPVLGTDFTATAKMVGADGNGVKYDITIKGKGNYTTISTTGVKIQKTIAGNSIENVFELKWNSDATANYVYDNEVINPFENGDLYIRNKTNNDKITKANMSSKGVVVTSTADTKDVGTKTLRVTIAGYTGELTENYVINPYDISANAIDTTGTNIKPTKVYTGNPIELVAGVDTVAVQVSHSNNNATLVEGTGKDYTITYKNNVDVGATAKVMVKGEGNYTGEREIGSFEIIGNLNLNATIVLINGAKRSTASDPDKDGIYTTDYKESFNENAIVPKIEISLPGKGVIYKNSISPTQDLGLVTVEAVGGKNENGTYDNDCVNAGTKYLKITGVAGTDCAGTELYVSYNITKRNIEDSDLVSAETTSDTAFIYDGTVHEMHNYLSQTDFSNPYDANGKSVPGYILFDNGLNRCLREGVEFDYSQTPSDQRNVTDTVTYTITGKGNYTGTITGSYSINQLDIKDCTITLEEETAGSRDWKYAGGAPVTPKVISVTYNGETIAPANYTVGYENNEALGVATVKITGKNNLNGTKRESFNIVKRVLAPTEIKIVVYANNKPYEASWDGTGYVVTGWAPTYTGLNQKPNKIEVYVGNSTTPLASGNAGDYSYTFDGDVKNASTTPTKKFTINFKNNYDGTGSKEVKYQIKPVQLTADNVRLSTTVQKTDINGDYDAVNDTNNQYYSYETSVVYNNKTLVKGTDYDLTLDLNATKAGGPYTYTIVGKGNYAGANSVTGTYTIGTDISNASVKLIDKITGQECAKEGTKYIVPFQGTGTNPTVQVGSYVINRDVELDWKSLDYSTDVVNAHGENGNNCTVTVKGKTNGLDQLFYGEKTIDFKIVPYDIGVYSGNADSYTGFVIEDESDITYRVSDKTFIYSGAEINLKMKATYKVEGQPKAAIAFTSDDQNISLVDIGTGQAPVIKDSGTYNIRVQADGSKNGGNYVGKNEIYVYTVKKPDQSNTGLLDVTVGDQIYTGRRIEPEPQTVKFNVNNLSDWKNYFTLDYPQSANGKTYDNTTVGEGKGIVRLVSNGELYAAGVYKDVEFKIVSANDPSLVEVNINPVTYQGDTQQNIPPTHTVKMKNISDPLVEGTDYDIEWDTDGNGDPDYKLPGTHTARITGKGVKLDSSINFTVSYNTLLSLSSNLVRVFYTGQDYNEGSFTKGYSVANHKDDFKVVYFKNLTDANAASASDYSTGTVINDLVLYDISPDNLNTPKENAKITFTGNDTGYVRGTCEYGPVKVCGTLADTEINVEFTNRTYYRTVNTPEGVKTLSYYRYTGNDITPEVAVKIGTGVDEIIVRPEQYTVTYTPQKTVGRYELKVEGKSGPGMLYPGTEKTVEYDIVYDMGADTTYAFKNNKTSYEYTGGEITPEVLVNFAGKEISSLNTSYFVTKYFGNKDTGTATVELSPAGSYIVGEPESLSFTITGIELNTGNTTITYDQTEKYYTGNEQKLENLVVTYNNHNLVENQDYRVKYVNNKDAGTATYSIIGLAPYSTAADGITGNFTIKPAPLSGATITVDTGYYDGGAEVRPNYTVEFNGHTLTKNVDYEEDNQTWGNNTAKTAGATISLKAKSSNFITDSRASGTFEIQALDLASADVKLNKESTEYTGEQFTLDSLGIELKTYKYDKENGRVLDKNNDYDLQITGAEKIQDKNRYQIDIVGKNNCSGTKTVFFTVTERSIKDNYKADGTGIITIDVENIDIAHFTPGADNKPNITIIDKGLKNDTIPPTPAGEKTLEEGVDYSVVLHNARQSGDGVADSVGGPYVTITGINNYKDSVDIGFKIGEDITDTMVSLDPDKPTLSYTYDANSHQPTDIKVTKGGVELTEDDYTVEMYSNLANGEYTGDDFTNAGTKYVLIKGKGKYYGTKVEKYTIDKKKVTPENKPKLSIKLGDGSDWVRYYLDENSQATEYRDKDGISRIYSTVYNGKPVVPKVTVYDIRTVNGKEEEFEVNEAYISNVRYDNNTEYTKEGTPANVIVSLTGNYADGYNEIKLPFTIAQRSLSGDETGDATIDFVVSNPDVKYRFTGDAIKPAIEVVYKENHNASAPLKEGVDYDLDYDNNIYPGTATITVTGKGSYTGKLTKSFDIVASIEKDVIIRSNGNTIDKNTWKLPDQLFTGSSPSIESFGIKLYLKEKNGFEYEIPQYVMVDGVERQNYSVSTSSANVNNGSIRIDNENSGYYDDSVLLTYDVTTNLTNVNAKAYPREYMYTGGVIVPTFKFYRGEEEVFITYRDRDVQYYYFNDDANKDKPVINNQVINVGRYYAKFNVTVGNNTKEMKAYFDVIQRNLGTDEVTINCIENWAYRGKNIAIEPPVVVKIGDVVVPESEYSVVYSNNKLPWKEGKEKPTIKIVGNNGNFTGEKEKNFNIYLQKVQTLRANVVGSNAIDLSWDVFTERVTGYYIEQEAKLDINGNKITRDKTDILDSKDTGYTSGNAFRISGLEGKCTYVYSVRPYLKVGNEEYLGEKVTVTTGKINNKAIQISVTPSAKGQVKVSWADPGNADLKADRYTIRRYEDGKRASTEKSMASYPSTSSSYTNKNLTSGTKYFYYVIGYRWSGTAYEEISRSAEIPVVVQ